MKSQHGGNDLKNRRVHPTGLFALPSLKRPTWTPDPNVALCTRWRRVGARLELVSDQPIGRLEHELEVAFAEDPGLFAGNKATIENRTCRALKRNAKQKKFVGFIISELVSRDGQERNLVRVIAGRRGAAIDSVKSRRDWVPE